ncbi:hypothetical protein ACF0H5_005746 [Mactra antiquata]
MGTLPKHYTVMAELIEKLTTSESSDEEVFVIQKLHSLLSTASSGQSDTSLSSKANDRDGSINLFGEGNPYPSSTPESICPSQTQLDKFTCYLFDRRFGWSETDTEDGRRVRKLSCSGATMSAGSSKQKAVLNTMLDSLIKWYLHQELGQPLLLAMKYTIKQTANMPVVRNRAVIHTMDWCKLNSEQLCDDSLFPEIQELIMISAMDVWSAIRNACAGRLAAVTANLSLLHVEKLFNSFVKVCEEDSSWQMKEGAIMGINAILQRFHNNTNSKSPMSSPRTLDTDIQERQIPDFITEKIHSVVFDLLSHTQLTIREHSAKTLATYITCSRITDALDTLSEVVQILKSDNETNSPRKQVYNGQFLDDYASEGFLGVCIFLVKVIPLNYLLPGWPEYISTFIHYLSHPASTVRQAASSVFKYLVVKSSHSVVILKLLLQALAMGWNPDTESMTLDITQDTVDITTPTVCQYTGSNLSETWEGREGRLFAYELIFRYLIKNHWLYTFGPAGSGLQMDSASNKDLSENSQDKTNETQNVLQGGETSSEVRGLHPVESEKCLAVRFLTQTDMNSFKLQKMERISSMDQESVPCTSLRTSSQAHGSGSSLSQYENTYSLLTQAKLLDHVNNDCSEKDKFLYKQDLQVKKLKQLIENNNNNKSSCCLVKPDNIIQCAKQVEKSFMSEIYHRLPKFISTIDLIDVIVLYPILAHYIGVFVDDSHICKILLECLQNNSSRMVELIQDSTDQDTKLYYMKCIVITLRELSSVMAMKSLDLQQIQKVLTIYEDICKPISLNQHLAVTLSAISSRLNESVEFSVDQAAIMNDDLYLMSNDIPISYSDPDIQDDSDSEEVIVGSPGTRFPESLMLNTSNNSGSFSGRLSSHSSHSGIIDTDNDDSTTRDDDDDDDNSSDWDSWDDEEEGQSAFGDVFTTFLQKLQKTNNTEFKAEIKNLGVKEKNVILGLIKV